MKLQANTNALDVVQSHTEPQEKLSVHVLPNASALAEKDALVRNNVAAKMEYASANRYFFKKLYCIKYF